MKRGGRSNDHTWMSYAQKASGPWSAPLKVLDGDIDSNLSPVIMKDGSLIGLWRGGLNSTRLWVPCAGVCCYRYYLLHYLLPAVLVCLCAVPLPACVLPVCL